MLYFIIEKEDKYGTKHKITIPWHTGETIPHMIFEQRVLTIQADGHELEQILEALED